MRVTPVRHKAAPRYPSRDVLIEHPELLHVVPNRWRNNPFVLKALSGTVSLILASQSTALAQQAATPAHVAPIFVHGEGQGAFGCVVVNPPVFLTEEEARAVIREEAKKFGVDFVPDAYAVKDGLHLQTNTTPLLDMFANRRTPEQGDLVLDGYNAKQKIGFEFVSSEDDSRWNPQQVRSTVRSVDVRHTAERLRDSLAKRGVEPWVGIFYEPGATASGRQDSSWAERRSAGRKLDEEELRKQVRDFIQWLKGQGVI